jgi:hypothetical protein
VDVRVNVSSVKRNEVAVKKKNWRLHTVLLFFLTPYSLQAPWSLRVQDLPWAHARLLVGIEEVDHKPPSSCDVAGGCDRRAPQPPAAGAESVVREIPAKNQSTCLLLIQMDGRSTGSNSRSVQDVVLQQKKSLIQQELGKACQEQPSHNDD